MRRLAPRAVPDADVEAAYADLASRRADGRAYVVVNMVASVDGAFSVAGQTKDLSSEADRFVFHHLRSLVDVILVGAQTVRAERYGPPRISEERQRARVARGQKPMPRIAVVTGSLDLDWTTAMFTESPTRPIVLTSESAEPDAVARARKVADVIVAGEKRVDLAAALGMLPADVVLCEGGPTLNGVLAGDDLIDELCLTVAPALIGGDIGAGILGHARLPAMAPVELVVAFEDGDNLFLRYRRTGGVRPIRDAATPSDEARPSDDREDASSFADIVAGTDYPMVIVTVSDGRERSGCLVGFSSQSSIDPPRFTVWLSKKNHTFGVAARSAVLAVHFPSSDQHDLAELFGGETGDEVDKFERCAWHEGPDGSVVLDDVTRWFAGRVLDTVDSGDHVAFLLEPVAGHTGPWPGQLGFSAVQDVEAGHDA